MAEIPNDDPRMPTIEDVQRWHDETISEFDAASGWFVWRALDAKSQANRLNIARQAARQALAKQAKVIERYHSAVDSAQLREAYLRGWREAGRFENDGPGVLALRAYPDEPVEYTLGGLQWRKYTDGRVEYLPPLGIGRHDGWLAVDSTTLKALAEGL